jgi:hypothetical protein
MYSWKSKKCSSEQWLNNFIFNKNSQDISNRCRQILWTKTATGFLFIAVKKKKKKEKESSVGNWQNKVYLLLGIKCS